MKLIELKIGESFRSLQAGFEIKFHKDELSSNLMKFHPFCLAGLNGYGKSNVLEALASIFYHLECCVHNYPAYAFSSLQSTPNIFFISYFIVEDSDSRDFNDLVKVNITKEKGKPPFMEVDKGTAFELTAHRGKNYLPDLVVAYSSGENEILSLPFIKMKLFQYDEYLNDYLQGVEYIKPKSSLLYVDYDMSQALLLTLFLFFDDKVLKPITDQLNIVKVKQFTINLNNYFQKVNGKDRSIVHFESIYKEDEHDSERIVGRIFDHLAPLIEKLENCSTCAYQLPEYKSLDFLIDPETTLAIRENFDHNPYKFFSLFQMLQALNERVENLDEKREIYNSRGFYTEYKKSEHPWFFYFTNYFIEKQDLQGNKTSLLLKNLSDGEQQFLHSLGICLMLQNKRALLLLDEPETHFNPDWRSKFIKILRQALKAGGDNFILKDILLTSHSPFIISDCMPDKVIKFDKEDNGVKATHATELNFNTFGASVEYILQNFFEVKNLVSAYSLDKMKKIIARGDEAELRRAIDLFGESNEKQFIFGELFKLKNQKRNDN